MSIVIKDEQLSLLDNLQVLLEKQIEYVRTDNLFKLEQSLEQTKLIIDKICSLKSFKKPETQWANIVKLYKKLELMLFSNKQSVGTELQQLGNVRKTFEIYRGKL